ncbi:MAG TPA: hydrogenase nickel incorporation protein HypB [Rhodopila sp.]|nr:hydrogenase nickel incorporation protein HypB [Rhodopila sp.]
MCQGCGCTVTAEPVSDVSVAVLSTLLRENESQAVHNRTHLRDAGVLALNLMSAPGSGKTSLLEATIDALAGRMRVGVIEGDLETENDARRIRAKGVPAVQITTGQACHLDAHMVHTALHMLDLERIDVLFIENVGNLVCPAGFDLGQWANVVLLAVTEGDDKPAKYPVMFRASDLVLMTKTDLLKAVGDFSPQRAESHLRDLASAAPVLDVSARKPDTLAPWVDWIEAQLVAARGG